MDCSKPSILRARCVASYPIIRARRASVKYWATIKLTTHSSKRRLIDAVEQHFQRGLVALGDFNEGAKLHLGAYEHPLPGSGKVRQAPSQVVPREPASTSPVFPWRISSRHLSHLAGVRSTELRPRLHQLRVASRLQSWRRPTNSALDNPGLKLTPLSGFVAADNVHNRLTKRCACPSATVPSLERTMIVLGSTQTMKRSSAVNYIWLVLTTFPPTLSRC
jgi:hypothetical protein